MLLVLAWCFCLWVQFPILFLSHYRGCPGCTSLWLALPTGAGHCLGGWGCALLCFDCCVLLKCCSVCIAESCTESVVCLFEEIGGLDASAAGPGFACKGHAGYLALFFVALLACSVHYCVLALCLLLDMLICCVGSLCRSQRWSVARSPASSGRNHTGFVEPGRQRKSGDLAHPDRGRF